MTGCKIGKIKMKTGGAEIRVFENSKYVHNDETDLLEDVLLSARRGDATGILIAFICKDGSTGYSLSKGCYKDAAKALGCAQHLVHLTHQTLFTKKKDRDWT